jgi:glycosyltransferase involved in cell wall biosynthesis
LASRYPAGFYSAVRNALMADDTEILSATPWLPPWQVIVVVDQNPALYDLLAAEYPDHEVISNKFETGLPGARNTGIEQAAGDVVVFIDDDARAQPQWLKTLLASYHDASVLGVGGVVLPDSSSPGRPAWLGRCRAEGCSKARVSRLSGASAALTSERSYVTYTITRAVRSELIGIFRPGRKNLIIRLSALLLGTLSAAAGYIREMALQNVRHAGPLGDAVSEGGTP